MKILNIAVAAVALTMAAGAASAGPVNTAPARIDRHVVKASPGNCAVAARAEPAGTVSSDRPSSEDRYALHQDRALYGLASEPMAPNRR